MISPAFFFFFCFNPKISCWHSENILHLLRNLSYLAVLPKGWNENCCLCSCLLVVCMMGLNVIFLFTGRTKKETKWKHLHLLLICKVGQISGYGQGCAAHKNILALMAFL